MFELLPFWIYLFLGVVPAFLLGFWLGERVGRKVRERGQD
jgi:membrane protein DedA with SNARE-associated domain